MHNTKRQNIKKILLLMLSPESINSLTLLLISYIAWL